MAAEKVAVIGGTGEEGFGLASRWAKAGIEVVIGSRDAGRAEAAAERLKEVVPGANVSGLENPGAAASSELLVVTVPFSGQAAIYKSIAESVRPDSVVVDGTVPVAASVGAKATHTLGVWEGSAAQQAAAFLPKGTRTCAAFHSLAAVALNDLDYEMEGDVLVCGPQSAKPVVRELVEAIPRLRFVDAGPLENARLVEPITALLIGINHRYHTDRSGIRITGV
ncbi:MAG: NADPH-dependent F420 reductase [Actinomycetota bacterium]|nr:NADPH-dependent F420 reductase [Actinomycetota bacterium]